MAGFTFTPQAAAPTTDPLGLALQAVAQAADAVGVAFGRLVPGVTAAQQVVARVTDGLRATVPALGEVTTAARSTARALTDLADLVRQFVAAAAARMNNAAGALPGPRPVLALPGPAGPGAGGPGSPTPGGQDEGQKPKESSRINWDATLALWAKAAVAGATAAAAATTRLAQAPLTTLNTAIGAIQANVAGFVGKLSPIHVQRFQLAVDDLYASIGKSLLPVLERFTAVVRVVGSVFNGLSASGQKAVQVLASAAIGMAVFTAAAATLEAVLTGGIGPIIGAVVGALGGLAFASGALDKAMKPLAETMGGVLNRVGQVLDQITSSDAFATMAVVIGEVIGLAAEFGATLVESLLPAWNALAQVVKAVMPAFHALAPLILVFHPLAIAIKVIAAAVEFLTPILVGVANAVSWVATRLGEFFRMILGFLGIAVPTVPRSTSSDNTGTAYRQAQTGGIEDILRKTRENAYSIGPGGGEGKKDPVVGAIQGIPNKLEEVKAGIVAAITGLPTELAKAILREIFGDKKGPMPGGDPGRGHTGSGPGGSYVSTQDRLADLAQRARDGIRDGLDQLPPWLRPW